MLRSAIISSLVFAAACGTEQDVSDPPMADEAAYTGDEALTGSLLTDRRGATYSVMPDYRLCIWPLCGGWWVAALNQAKTTCADGTQADACYVAEIAFDELGLSDRQLAELREAAHRGQARLYGIQSRGDLRQFPELGTFHPRRAWTAATDQPAKGRSFRMEDLGFVCIAHPCFNIRAHLVNHAKYADVSGLDLSAVRATDEQLAAARRALLRGDLLTDGTVERDSALRARIDRAGRTMVASQFFLPLLPASISPTP
jgi:hypothetical protein